MRNQSAQTAPTPIQASCDTADVLPDVALSSRVLPYSSDLPVKHKMTDLARGHSQHTAGTAVEEQPVVTALAAGKNDADVEKLAKKQQDNAVAADNGTPPPNGKEVLDDPYTPPDGGLKAWATVVAAWLILFSSFVSLQCGTMKTS